MTQDPLPPGQPITAQGFNALLCDLQSGDCLRQLEAAHKFSVMGLALFSPPDQHLICHTMVRAMENSQSPHVIAECLWKMKAPVHQLFLEMLARPAPSDAKLFAAYSLIKSGNHAGVSILLREVEQYGNWYIIASRELLHAGIKDHQDYIFQKLRQLEITHSTLPQHPDDEAMTLLEQLVKHQIQIPQDIQTKYGSPNAPSYFKAILATK